MSPSFPWAYGLDEVRFDTEAKAFHSDGLSQILESVPLAIGVSLGLDHRFIFANRLLRSALRSTEGRTVGEVLKDSADGFEALRATVFETGLPQETSGLQLVSCADGKPTFWDVKLLPVRNDIDQVIGILTLASDVTDRVTARAEAEHQARRARLDTERLSLAVEATELGLWEWDLRTEQTFWSDRQKSIFGLALDRPATYAFWESALHPDDRERVLQGVSASTLPESSGQLHMEHRVVHPDGTIRWVLSRGRMFYERIDGFMKPVRLLGTVLDITDRRESEESRQLLVRELDHRVKNVFAMTSSMVALSARSAGTPQDMARSLNGRLEALARAHELIRPAISGVEISDRATSIGEIAEAVLAPHRDDENARRLVIDGPRVIVGAGAATALTLTLHELATNALKYGALSTTEGSVAISWTTTPEYVTLTWDERHGPTVNGAPAETGFGSKLARKSITSQLAGEIHYDWRREGLAVRMCLPLEPLTR